MNKAAKDFNTAVHCACNTDGKGGVSFEELLNCQEYVDALFPSAVVEATHPKHITKEIFEMLDKNGDGEIDVDEGDTVSHAIIAHLGEIGLLDQTAISKDVVNLQSPNEQQQLLANERKCGKIGTKGVFYSLILKSSLPDLSLHK